MNSDLLCDSHMPSTSLAQTPVTPISTPVLSGLLAQYGLWECAILSQVYRDSLLPAPQLVKSRAMECSLHLQPEMLVWPILFGWPCLHAHSVPDMGQHSGSLAVPWFPQGVVLSHASGL